MKLSTSASPPRIFSGTETCVKSGVLSVHESPTLKNEIARLRVQPVVDEVVAHNLDERQLVQDVLLLHDRFDDARQDHVVSPVSRTLPVSVP